MVRTTRVTIVEFGALASSVSIWITVIALQASEVFFVPEHTVAVNVMLLISLLAFTAVVCEQLWRRLRWWWSVPISIVAIYAAFLIALFPVQELRYQLGPASDEGFLYADGFGVCGTYVDGIFENTNGKQRIYVLQEYCVPDGPESTSAYRQLGKSPLMKRIDSVPAALHTCHDWRAGRQWVTLIADGRSRIASYCSRSREERAPAE